MASCPNLPGYFAFLTSNGIPPSSTQKAFPGYSGTVSAGTVSTLTDIAANWPPNQWTGCVVFDVTQGWGGVVISNTATEVSFIVSAGDVQLIDSSGGLVTDSGGNTIGATGNTLGLTPAPGDQYIIAQSVASMSLAVALQIVNRMLQRASTLMYGLAVYNLATDRLLNFAQDQPGQTYFQDLRAKYKLLDLAVGVVQSASDQGTSGAYVNLETMKNFTLMDLATLKTPFGRRYMEIAMSFGPDIFGLG